MLQAVSKQQHKKFKCVMVKNCQEVFKSLELLKNFGATNFIGFKKIWKKYKKNAAIAPELNIDDLL